MLPSQYNWHSTFFFCKCVVLFLRCRSKNSSCICAIPFYSLSCYHRFPRILIALRCEIFIALRLVIFIWSLCACVHVYIMDLYVAMLSWPAYKLFCIDIVIFPGRPSDHLCVDTIWYDYVQQCGFWTYEQICKLIRGISDPGIQPIVASSPSEYHSRREQMSICNLLSIVLACFFLVTLNTVRESIYAYMVIMRYNSSCIRCFTMYALSNPTINYWISLTITDIVTRLHPLYP